MSTLHPLSICVGAYVRPYLQNQEFNKWIEERKVYDYVAKVMDISTVIK